MRLTLLTLLVMVAFAANSVLNRAALIGGGNDALSFAALRVLAGAVVLGAIATALRRGDWLRRLRGPGAVMLAIYVIGFSLATPPASSDRGAGPSAIATRASGTAPRNAAAVAETGSDTPRPSSE